MSSFKGKILSIVTECEANEPGETHDALDHLDRCTCTIRLDWSFHPDDENYKTHDHVKFSDADQGHRTCE